MSKIINELIESQNTNHIKLVPDNEKDIMKRYLQLRKLAISYWDIFSFSLGYCLIFPIIHMIKIRNKTSTWNFPILSSFFFAYFFYKYSLKHITRMFNRKDFETFEIYCKKYKLEDDKLI